MGKTKKVSKKKLPHAGGTPRDYERLGRSLESVFTSGYISRGRLYWISFTRGIFFGLGVTIGGTVVVATLIWLLSHFTELPLIGELADTIGNTLDN